MKKLRMLAVLCTFFAFCSATAIVSPAQVLTTLHSFVGTDGHRPTTLVQATDGNFYGTTVVGGNLCSSDGCGTVFKITPNGALTTLHKFCSLPNCVDGYIPEAGVMQAADGNFYGTTEWGGSNNAGTIFRITANGTLTTLYNFCSQPNCADGGSPFGGLVQASDGNFYGTTNIGANGNPSGTVFKFIPNGTLITLYSFCSQLNCADGAGPSAGLVQATDGNFYGTTYYGGTNQCYQGCGTVFKITPAGVLTTLHNFAGYPTDGAYPYAGLMQAKDGNFYGTTVSGGASQPCQGSIAEGCGSVFKMTPTGTLAILHSFDSTDGSSPQAGVIQATDGSFYGTAFGAPYYGGGSPGSLFRITAGGTFNVLYSFCSQNPCSDGLGPWGLVQGADGDFYGTTLAGGSGNCLQGCGTVFRLVPASVTPAQFVSITPCRLVDTRSDVDGPIPSGTYRTFTLPQLAQSKGCPDIGSAVTYSLNVTLVPLGGAPVSYLTVWPAGSDRPLVSTMNSLDGRIKANAAIVPAGAAGAVNVYVTDTTDVVLDIDGYFATPSAQTLQFYPLTPCRVADTRSDAYPQGLGTPHLSQGVARDFPVLASSCIPQNVNPAAYSLNFTAIPYPSLGDPLAYLEVWPTGQQPQHPVSTLNNPTATYVANAAIVPAGTGGKITAYGSDNTDLAIDINGYFATPGTGGLSLYPTVPCRVFDSRKVGSGQPFSGLLAPPVDVVDSPCGVPNTAQAYVFNATVVPSGNLSYLTLWPDSEGRPIVSTLNAADGWITSNMAIVPNLNGSVDAYAAGITHLVLDISSYFAP